MSAATVDLSAPRTRLALFLLAAPALVWLVGLIVLPHVDLAALSLRARVAPRTYDFSFDNYRTFIDEPLYWHTFVRTAAMSIIATACTLAIGFPTAWYIVKIARGHAKSVLLVLCLIPFWVSETVRTLGWMILLRESGVVPQLLVRFQGQRRPVQQVVEVHRVRGAFPGSTGRICHRPWNINTLARFRAQKRARNDPS